MVKNATINAPNQALISLVWDAGSVARGLRSRGWLSRGLSVGVAANLTFSPGACGSGCNCLAQLPVSPGLRAGTSRRFH
jgi:hypothetical protein